MIQIRYTLLLLIILLRFAAEDVTVAGTLSDNSALVGSITGQVTDAITHSPVPAASVTISGTSQGAVTDSSGRFAIENVSPGHYTLVINSIAFYPRNFSDIVVNPGKTTAVYATLQYRPFEMDGTLVKGSYFTDTDLHQTSRMELSSGEISRSPGSAGDISRIIKIHPGVAKVDDQVNSLIVRGGSSVENGFYVDNIEVPNISHFPENLSGGGGWGLLNPDFIENISFSAGGFSAGYGGKLSSITEINLKEGNSEKFETAVDANFGGVALTAEGPIKPGRGSMLFSYRRSFLEFLTDMVDFDFIPRFEDYLGKVVYDISSRNRLSFLVIAGQDDIDFSKDRSIAQGWSKYGRDKSKQFTAGVNWKYLYGSKGYSNTSLAFLQSECSNAFFWISNDAWNRLIDTRRRSLRLRHVSVFRISESGHLKFGIDGQFVRDRFDINVGTCINPLGGTFPGGKINREINSASSGLFAEYTARPIRNLHTTLGLRYDYHDLTGHGQVSPRFSFAYDIAPGTSLNGAAGIYYQTIPMGIIAQDESAVHLKDPTAYHYILGLNRLMAQSVKLTLEAYLKNYNFFPLDTRQPKLFVIDGLVHWGYLGYYRALVDAGKSRAYGIELTLQKRPTSGLYGIACGAWSKSKYLGLDGIWRDRLVDNRITLGLEGGILFNNGWRIGLQWIFAGGAPYTPLDLELSKSRNIDIFDMTRINAERYPDYHILSLRFERQFTFRKSSLSLYLELFNLYNRDNVYRYYWNETERKQDTFNQYGFVPLLGLKLEL